MPVKKCILVVEDDVILKNLLAHTFADRYEMLYASDGNEAIQIFDQKHPVFILLDLMLPTMDGFQVLQAIRAKPEGQTVPVIIISNLGQDGDKARAFALGANGYMVKAEVDIDEIVKRIEDTMKGVAGPAPAAAAPAQPPAPPAPGTPGSV